MTELRQKALDLLANREHSTHQLKTKLRARGFAETDIAVLLSALTEENLQSDERFAEAYVHSRINAGYGPLRIQAELLQRKVDKQFIAQYLDLGAQFWWTKMVEVWQKKFGREQTTEAKELAKQFRFLSYRGFSGDAISRLLKREELDREE